MKLNEKHFNYSFVAVTVAVISYLLFDGNVDKNSIIGMFGAMSFNVSLLLGLGFGLQYFQLGTKRDIQKEIFDEHNIAASIYQAGIWIALAIVISKGIM